MIKVTARCFLLIPWTRFSCWHEGNNKLCLELDLLPVDFFSDSPWQCQNHNVKSHTLSLISWKHVILHYFQYLLLLTWCSPYPYPLPKLFSPLSHCVPAVIDDFASKILSLNKKTKVEKKKFSLSLALSLHYLSQYDHLCATTKQSSPFHYWASLEILSPLLSSS